MSDEREEGLGEVRVRAREASEVLEAWAVEALQLTKLIEELTDGTPGRYRGRRTRVEAAEALRQARLFVRTLEDLDKGARARGGGA